LDQFIKGLETGDLSAALGSFGGLQLGPRVVGCAASLSLAHGWYSRGRESLALDHNQTELIVPSLTPSCCGPSGGASFHVAAMVGH